MPRSATRTSAEPLSSAFLTFAAADLSLIDESPRQKVRRRRRTSSAPPAAKMNLESLPDGLRHLPPEDFFPTPSATLPPPADGDGKRRGHNRRQQLDHPPRPRNAFILFRCDFVRQRKVPSTYENDYRNISRIAGEVWHTMPEERRAPWRAMAELERKQHAMLYPGYTYVINNASPTKKGTSSKKGKRKIREPQVEPGSPVESSSTPSSSTPLTICAPTPILTTDFLSMAHVGRRRSSSCPLPPIAQDSDAFLYADRQLADPRDRYDLYSEESNIGRYEEVHDMESQNGDSPAASSDFFGRPIEFDPAYTMAEGYMSPGQPLLLPATHPPTVGPHDFGNDAPLDTTADVPIFDYRFHHAPAQPAPISDGTVDPLRTITATELDKKPKYDWSPPTGEPSWTTSLPPQFINLLSDGAGIQSLTSLQRPDDGELVHQHGAASGEEPLSPVINPIFDFAPDFDWTFEAIEGHGETSESMFDDQVL